MEAGASTSALESGSDDLSSDGAEPPPHPGSVPAKRPLKDVIPWEEYLMALAFLTARRSGADVVTKAGAVIIRGMSTEGQAVRKIIGIGYAASPKGYMNGECQDKYVVNAIFNKSAEDLTDCTLFTTHFPTSDDAKLIIQAGIRRIVYYHEGKLKHGGIPQIMFDKVGVACFSFEGFREICVEQRIISHRRRAENHRNAARRCYARGEAKIAKAHRKRIEDCDSDIDFERKYCKSGPRSFPLYPVEKLRVDVDEAALAGINTYVHEYDYYMAVALLSAERSKDDSRQVGACIIDQSTPVPTIVGIGYNGWPYGISDNDPEIPWGKKGKHTKYEYVVHAEANAIMHKTCIDLKGCTIFTTLFPCIECAKLIIKSGITTIHYLSDDHYDRPGTIKSRELLRKEGYTLDKDPPPAKRRRRITKAPECSQYKPKCHIQVVFEATGPRRSQRQLMQPQKESK